MLTRVLHDLVTDSPNIVASESTAVGGGHEHVAGDAAERDDAWFQAWRTRELSRVDRAGLVYADYTGAALYPESLIRRDADRLTNALLGNPHSEHSASRTSTRDLDDAKRAILDFLHASPDEYCVVLTANASAACRLVAESFPFVRDGALLLAADNHNSVNGIGEYARRAGTLVATIALDAELRLAGACEALDDHRTVAPSLFAFPAQSNFSGVRHPLQLIDEAQRHGWRVLLDAASYLSSSELRLDEIQPDFVVLSLYKIIGHPTGLGALVARHDALRELDRPWFAGGTVQWVSVDRRTHRLLPGAERFEDGTPAFSAAGIVAASLAAASEVDRGRLARQLSVLTARTLAGLRALTHRNGTPLVAIHGPACNIDRGPTIAITLADSDARAIPYWEVEGAARDANIAMRGGCFCNPGCAEAVFHLATARAASCLDALGADFTIPRFARCLDEQAVGALRLSYGLGSVQADVDRLIAFFARYLN